VVVVRFRQPSPLLLFLRRGLGYHNHYRFLEEIDKRNKHAVMKYQSKINLPNDIQTVPQLESFVEAAGEAAGLDASVTMSLNLALEEAVVNVMTYAYPPEGYGEVDIEANVDDDWLRFIISDKGIPFDPTVKEDVDTSLSAEERQIGGLGIHLVRTIMDNISYERRDHQNVLTLGKKLNVANV
jgi:anti-sigma regulatory factor (Ser/Thr protein kinase)